MSCRISNPFISQVAHYVVALLFLTWPPLLNALDLVTLSLGSMSGEGWSVQDIQVDLGFNEDGSHRASVRAADIQIEGLKENIHQLNWQCDQLLISDKGYRCEDSQLQLAESLLGQQTLQMAVSYQNAGDWRATVDGLRYGKGRLSGHIVMRDGLWSGHATGESFSLAEVRRLLPPEWLPKDWEMAGKLALQADFSGDTRLQQLDTKIQVDGLNYSDVEGLQVGEGLALNLSLKGKVNKQTWDFSSKASLSKGQLYSDPVYLDAANIPPQLNIKGRWAPRQQNLDIRQLSFLLPGVLETRGKGRVNTDLLTFDQLQLGLDMSALDEAYKVLLQPLLIGSGMDNLELSGAVSAQLELVRSKPVNLAVRLDKVDMDEKDGKYGLYGLTGEVHWSESAVTPHSMINWQGGHVYKVDFADSGVDFSAKGDELKLNTALELPMLGGRVRLTDFLMKGLSSGSDEWQLSADVQGIQLKDLSQALDWPLLEGEVYGHIPRVQFKDSIVRVEGELTVDAFDGRLSVQELMVQEPFGVAPVIEADFSLHNLDMEQLTRTFSFGRIEGRLNGEVNDLQLIGRQPNRFKARFYTPESDTSRHRISQRAVDNLTSLGNGISGSLSQTFLRFFDDFGYDRLELSVALDGSTAELDGIRHKEGGYYIVRGSGLPRIDVIGRNRKVAWQDLVNRLKDIRFEGAVVN